MAKNIPTFLIFALQKRKNRMKTALLAILIVGICFVLLGVKVLFIKGGKFPSHHAHSSPELRRRGVGCATHQR